MILSLVMTNSLIAGSYVQTVLPFDRYTGPFNFANPPSAHKTETDDKATFANRLQIYSEWRRYWNTSRSILAEKSPRFMLVTRLLQFWFTPSQSYFIGIIRHPLGTLGGMATMRPSNYSIAHMAGVVKHWIHSNRLMLDDMQHLQHAALIRYETFAAGDQGGLCLICDGWLIIYNHVD